MKRWSIVLGLFYLLALLVIWFPIIGLIFAGSASSFNCSLWFLVPVILIFGPTLLIYLSVGTSQRYLRAKQHIYKPVSATIFLLALLIGGAISSMLVALAGDEGLGSIFFSSYLFLAPVVSWIIWMVIFYKNIKMSTKWSIKWLRKGSVLELLIAVPSHIISRSRGDCCAPLVTSVGICLGLSIMLFSFGPAILLLYKEKIASKQAKKHRIAEIEGQQVD